MHSFKLLPIIFILSSLHNIQASSYFETLPKGVRTFVYKNISTNQINSSYNHTKTKVSMAYDLKLNAESLSKINMPELNEFLGASNNAFGDLNLGEYNVDGSSTVKANALGFGYGIGKKVTVYAGIPVIDAKVEINYKRTKGNNYDHLIENLIENQTGDTSQFLGNTLQHEKQTLDVDAQLFQKIVVDQLGYKPVGNWYGHGLGDLELGMMYQLYNRQSLGLKTVTGVTAPTGRIDDPNIIQDVAFGDGQWDIFAELGGSYHVSSQLLFNLYGRYTYQISSLKELRRPLSEDFPLSSETALYNEKLGNKLLLHADINYQINSWFQVNTGYELESTGKSKYKSRFTKDNSILAKGTESQSNRFLFGLGFSTINLYKAGQFIAPASLNINLSKTILGMNTPKVDMLELELQLFF